MLFEDNSSDICWALRISVIVRNLKPICILFRSHSRLSHSMITALVTTLFVICIRDTYIKIRFATKFSKLSDFTREGLYDLYEKDCYGPTKLE